MEADAPAYAVPWQLLCTSSTDRRGGYIRWQPSLVEVEFRVVTTQEPGWQPSDSLYPGGLPPGGSRVIRNNANYWISIVMCFAILIFSVAVDFLHLFRAFSPPDENVSFLASLPYVVAPIAATALFVLLGVRPSVEVSTSVLTIRNPFRTLTAGRGEIVDFQAVGAMRFAEVRLSNGTRWRILALESWNFSESEDAKTLSQMLQSVPAEPAQSDELRVSRTRAGRVEITLALLWLAYVAAAALSTLSGLSPAPFA